jgi:hypothetical protein
MSNIINLEQFKRKKEIDQDLARGRTPLYVSHATGKITGSKDDTKPGEDFADRLTRIRTSLDKINRLMNELKRMSADESRSY